MPRAPEQVRISDTKIRSGEFTRYIRHILEAKGDAMLAENIAHQARTPSRVSEVLKAAVSAGSTIPGGDWGAALVAHGEISSGFLESMQQTSVFDFAVPSMVQLPLNPPMALAMVTAGVVAGMTGEGIPRPVGRMTLATQALEPYEASAIVVVSDELARAGNMLDQLLNSELRAAVSKAMNEFFMSAIVPGGSPSPDIVASGTDADDVCADLADAISQLDLDMNSRVVVAVPQPIALRLTFMTDAAGHPCFPGMTLQGGTIGHVPVRVTDALNAQHVMVLDAYGFAGAPGEIVLDSSNQATIEFDDAPDNPADANTVMQSLWHTGRRAVMVKRRFGFRQMRTNAVRRIVNVQWGNPS